SAHVMAVDPAWAIVDASGRSDGGVVGRPDSSQRRRFAPSSVEPSNAASGPARRPCHRGRSLRGGPVVRPRPDRAGTVRARSGPASIVLGPAARPTRYGAAPPRRYYSRLLTEGPFYSPSSQILARLRLPLHDRGDHAKLLAGKELQAFRRADVRS